MRTYSSYLLLIDVCVTNRCNLHCSYCSAEAGPFASKKDEMSIDLEYYSFDEIGAEILYCISKNFSLDKIIEVIQDEYDVNYADCMEAIINFLKETPILHIIYANLIKSDIYLYLKPFREE